MTTPTIPSYLILPLPRTKPVRFIVLIDDKTYVSGVTRAIARDIVLGHLLTHNPDLVDETNAARDFILHSGI